MDAQVVVSDVASALTKLKTLVDAANGSPITAAMEGLLPGLTGAMQDAEAVADIAGTVAGFLPYVGAVIDLIEVAKAMGATPMEAGADPHFNSLAGGTD